VGLLVVNLINIGFALLYGIMDSGYTNIVLLISMLLTSAVLAITWGLYNRSQTRRQMVVDPPNQDNDTILLPIDTTEEEGVDVNGYGHVPYSTTTRTGAIRCKRCLLINEASSEGQTCKHCGTYLLLKH
jgi:hypothetical protein